MAHRPWLAMVRPDTRNCILMDCEQHRVALALTRTRQPRARLSSLSSVLEGVERRTIEPADRARACTGTTRRLGGRRIIERADCCPPALGPGEHDWLTVVPSSDEGILGGPCESDEGEGVDLDGLDCRTAGVDDADGTVVTFGCMLSI